MVLKLLYPDLNQPTNHLLECLDILVPSITKLVNCSLSEGVVPADFKKAVVTPLIKKSSLPPDDLKNYRPVSGLCFISKLAERVVASQLNDCVCSNGLENVKQSAYKSLLWLEVRPLLLCCLTNQQLLTQPLYTPRMF